MRRKKSKKGEIMWGLVISIIIVGLILGGVAYLLYKSGRSVENQFYDEISESRNELCKKRTAEIKLALKDTYGNTLPSHLDVDNDGLHDGCDPCVMGDKSDYDLDGMPDACDEQPRNPKNKNCNANLNTNLNRCETADFNPLVCLQG